MNELKIENQCIWRRKCPPQTKLIWPGSSGKERSQGIMGIPARGLLPYADKKLDPDICQTCPWNLCLMVSNLSDNWSGEFSPLQVSPALRIVQQIRAPPLQIKSIFMPISWQKWGSCHTFWSEIHVNNAIRVVSEVEFLVRPDVESTFGRLRLADHSCVGITSVSWEHGVAKQSSTLRIVIMSCLKMKCRRTSATNYPRSEDHRCTSGTNRSF